MALSYLTEGEAREKGVQYRSRSDIDAANRAAANPSPQPMSSVAPPPFTSSSRVYDTGREGHDAVPGVDDMINRDAGSWEQTLRQGASAYGLDYDPSDLEGIVRNVSYAQNAGRDPADFIRQQLDIYAKRAAPTGHRRSDSQSGLYNTNADPRSEPGYRAPAFQPDITGMFPQLFGRAAGAPTSGITDPGRQMPNFQASGTSNATAYPGFDTAAYQAYRQANPNNPLSPFEFAMGRPWTEADDAALAAGQTPQGVTPAAIQVYESGGLQWPGPRPAQGAPGSAPTHQGTAPAGGSGSGGSGAGVPGQPGGFQNMAPLFDDPASRLIEDYALDRFQQRQNPDPNSGTAIFEQYARELIETLKQPVHSPQEEAAIKGSAIDAIEQERSATKQRWIEEMSRRNITPSSGIFLEGILKIDEHFNQARNVFEREFAIDAIDKTRQQRFQVLDTAGQLAGSEEGRLREALTYASIPKQLQDNSFQQGLQLVGAGGSPQSILQSAMQIAQLNQNQSIYDSQRKAALTQGLMQYLGYAFGGR